MKLIDVTALKQRNEESVVEFVQRSRERFAGQEFESLGHLV